MITKVSWTNSKLLTDVNVLIFQLIKLNKSDQWIMKHVHSHAAHLMVDIFLSLEVLDKITQSHIT